MTTEKEARKMAKKEKKEKKEKKQKKEMGSPSVRRSPRIAATLANTGSQLPSDLSLTSNKKDKKDKKEKSSEKKSKKRKSTDTDTDTTETDRKAKKAAKKLKKEEKKKKAEEQIKAEEKKQKKLNKKEKKPENKETEEKKERPAPKTAADFYRQREEIFTPDISAILPDPYETFDKAPFSPTILSALKNAGFPAPSPIQAQGWPIALAGKDLIAVAKTGSGKTLAFLLPIMHMCGSSKVLEAVVLAPTRELASQIKAECDKFSPPSFTSVCVYGGVPKHAQIAGLKAQPNLIIATPGRLLDFVGTNTVSLKQVLFLVMDEADRMLDMGFEPQIKKLVGECKSAHQTLFFTATWPKSVQKLADKYIRAEKTILHVGATEELAANKAVSQEFFCLDDSEKDAKLWQIIEDMPDNGKLLAFANNKRRVDNLHWACKKYGFGASAMHGDKTQDERQKSLKQFATGEWPLMFATDVVARGLDIDGVTHVVNYDMPRDVDNYIHRIGRTGRAGKTGAAITFWNPGFDMQCSPALVKIAEEAGQVVPPWLTNYAKKAKQTKQWKY